MSISASSISAQTSEYLLGIYCVHLSCLASHVVYCPGRPSICSCHTALQACSSSLGVQAETSYDCAAALIVGDGESELYLLWGAGPYGCDGEHSSRPPALWATSCQHRGCCRLHATPQVNCLHLLAQNLPTAILAVASPTGRRISSCQSLDPSSPCKALGYAQIQRCYRERST